MASSSNGRFSEIVLTFRGRIGVENILLYVENTKTFDACFSDYMSGVNVMNDRANLELICIKFAHKILQVRARGARVHCNHR